MRSKTSNRIKSDMYRGRQDFTMMNCLWPLSNAVGKNHRTIHDYPLPLFLKVSWVLNMNEKNWRQTGSKDNPVKRYAYFSFVLLQWFEMTSKIVYSYFIKTCFWLKIGINYKLSQHCFHNWNKKFFLKTKISYTQQWL